MNTTSGQVTRIAVRNPLTPRMIAKATGSTVDTTHAKLVGIPRTTKVPIPVLASLAEEVRTRRRIQGASADGRPDASQASYEATSRK